MLPKSNNENLMFPSSIGSFLYAGFTRFDTSDTILLQLIAQRYHGIVVNAVIVVWASTSRILWSSFYLMDLERNVMIKTFIHDLLSW